jgi:hypothetical protein
VDRRLELNTTLMGVTFGTLGILLSVVPLALLGVVLGAISAGMLLQRTYGERPALASREQAGHDQVGWPSTRTTVQPGLSESSSTSRPHTPQRRLSVPE